MKSAIGIVICFAILIVIFSYLPVTYYDWSGSFFEAASNLKSPYGSNTFNPPWLYVLIHPLTWFGERIGVSLLIIATFVILAYYLKDPKKMLAIGFSAPLVALVTLGQIDGLVLIGFLVPSDYAPLFFLMKPQGIFLATLRRISWKSIAIVAIALILSFVIWGNWLMEGLDYLGLTNGDQNISLFPFTIPVGLCFLYTGLKRRSDACLCLASLCFSPYFMITSLLPFTAAAIKESENKHDWVAVVLATWIYFFLTKFWIL